MAQRTNISWCDADKKAARSAVNVEVAAGRLPRPNDLACVDCDHEFVPGGQRHEYDHHLGYDRENWLKVEPVCKRCHVRRDNLKAQQTHCGQGHEFTPENTRRKANGTRECRTCRREWDSNKHRGRDAAYWRNYRAERKARRG